MTRKQSKVPGEIGPYRTFGHALGKVRFRREGDSRAVPTRRSQCAALHDLDDVMRELEAIVAGKAA